MIAEIFAGIGGLGALVFAFLAWRARGEALDAKDAASQAADARRAAEAATEIAQRHADEAAAVSVAAEVQRKAAADDAAKARSELEAERSARMAAYEKLAQLGAPVGDVLVDDAVGRLFGPGQNGDSHGGKADPGAGRDRPVSDDASKASGDPPGSK